MELNRIYQGDCLKTLKALPDNSVDCCVTSPPYFGLRDYGHAGQIGLEETPQAFVKQLVKVFEEVRRLLKPNGTCWVNLGDSYCGYKGDNYGKTKGNLTARTPIASEDNSHGAIGTPQSLKNINIKNKDLIGIPWRVAFALQEAGWYLRQDIIWHKPNPMPESVTDRCTKSHEYIFLLSKSDRYYFDNESIKEKAIAGANGSQFHTGKTANARQHLSPVGLKERNDAETRNKRSVWTVATKPFSEAHFATYPEELITPCIKAGCPPNGIVLDPFMGAGTTALVATSLGRQFVGCELNPDYIAIAHNRLNQKLGIFSPV